MPTIITRGAGSARGYGFSQSSGPPAPVLQTVTFTSSGTWVAPAGVTLVTTLTGKGQDGDPGGYWIDIYSGDGGTVSYVEASAPSGISSSTIEARAQAEWDKFPSTYNVNGSVVDWTYWYYYVNTVQEYAISGLIRLKNGYSKTKTGNGWGSSYTTPITGYRAYDVGNMEQYVGASTGANSSAFGYTFAGGAGGPATPVTYNNVPVTSGSSYSISVPSGGYVVIQYYT